VETCPHLHRTVQQIRELGVRPGVTLNPATSLETLREILPYVEQVLVMTVNPGFGGQGYIPTMTAKIARLAAMIGEAGLSVDIEVDGGIDLETTPEVVAAGARVLVAGTSIFRNPAGVAEGSAALRRAAHEKVH
jgi:ribulose-phosphate 3-epimerase